MKNLSKLLLSLSFIGLISVGCEKEKSISTTNSTTTSIEENSTTTKSKLTLSVLDVEGKVQPGTTVEIYQYEIDCEKTLTQTKLSSVVSDNNGIAVFDMDAYAKDVPVEYYFAAFDNQQEEKVKIFLGGRMIEIKKDTQTTTSLLLTGCIKQPNY